MYLILFGSFLPPSGFTCRRDPNPDPDRVRVHASAAHPRNTGKRSAYNGKEMDAVMIEILIGVMIGLVIGYIVGHRHGTRHGIEMVNKLLQIPNGSRLDK